MRLLRPNWCYALLASVMMSACFGVTARADEAADAKIATNLVSEQVTAAWNDGGRKLVAEYCIDCHNRDFQEAELDLETGLDASEMVKHRDHWEKILQRVRFGSMPPEDASQPTDDERAQMVASIEAVVYGGVCDLEPKPGRVTVHRLNRAEYNNTIRDIFGQDLKPADEFPSDEVGAGFDNNSDVLSLPPMLFEKYMAAAEHVASQVILDPEQVERINVERSGDSLFSIGERKTGSFYKFYMLEDGVVWCEFDTKLAGKYRLKVDGSSGREGEEAKLAVYDKQGKPLESFKLGYSDGGGTRSHRFEIDLPVGKERFFVGYLKPDQEPLEQLPAVTLLTEAMIEEARASVGKSLQVDGKFDRGNIAFAIKRFELEGPIETPESLLPPRHRTLISAKPNKKKSAAEAARPGLEWLLRHAFRGKVDAETVETYQDLVERAYEREKSFERAMRVAVTAALVSPRFLFRVELPPEDAKPGEKTPLDDYQLASRLSYFLWSSTPDETLLKLADERRLAYPQVFSEQVSRMLDDPRSQALADNFAAQWLGLRNLRTVQPDTNQFNEFSPELLESMREETRQLFLDILTNNRSILDLLDANETYVNESLSKFYGIEGVSGSEFRKVSLADVPRRGILTHASVLTLTSNPTRTSPVKRGKWILENVLGTPPPEPPAGVPELEETGKANPDAPLREQLEIHRADPACASCHRVMDVLGFGFENFDAIGKFRQKDGKFAVDASGELPGGLTFGGPLDLITILRSKYGTQFAETSTARLMTFALGRELKFEDRCVITDITEETKANGHRFRDLVTAVVLSPLFRYQQLEGESP